MGLKKFAKSALKKGAKAAKRYSNPIRNVTRAYGNVREGVEEQSKRLRRTAKGWGPEAVRWGATALGTAAGAMVGAPQLGYALGSQAGGMYANKVYDRRAKGTTPADQRQEAAMRLVRRPMSRQAGSGQIKYTDESYGT